MNVLPRTKRLFAPILVAVSAWLFLSGAAAMDPGPPSGNGPLDGMVFAGQIGPADNPDRADHLYFADGQFWSGECVRCGFEPGVYWVRHTADGIAFRGVLESAERGTFTYKGMVRDGRIDVSINWRHERWYWTIDRDLRFIGELVSGGTAGMTIDEARAMAGGDQARGENCPS